MKSWLTKKDRLLAGTIIGASLAALAGPAMAQDATAPGEDQTAEEEIIVTGSRIPQPNVQAGSPIQVVQSQEFLLQGTYEVSNVLNNLPQNFQQPGIDFSNTPNPLTAPGGLTTANLRGLGPQRTLVLIDGVRLGVGDSHTGNPNPGPNLDTIPGPLIERVEVVTGGASAVYGSDAVAGVINFIMRDDFEGVEINGQYGFAQHDNDNTHIQDIIGDGVADGSVTDGENSDFSIVMGTTSDDGRSNVTAYLGYHRQTPVSQGERDFSGCLLFSDGVSDFFCANSSNSNLFTNANTGEAFAVFGNTFVEHPLVTGVDPGINPPPTFNSSPFLFLSRDDTRYTAGFMARHEFSDHAELYAQVNFMDDRSRTEVAPSGLFGQNGVFQINCDNPLLSAQQVGAICTGVADTDPVTPGNQGNASLVIGRRNVEGGPRQNFYEHETYRMLVGVRGELTEGWSYNVYGQYYYSTVEQFLRNELNRAKVRNALQVVDVDGVPTCQSVVDGSDPRCVPWNIFQEGGVTDAGLDYISAFGAAWGSTQQQIVNASINGDLGAIGFKSPFATDAAAIALGTEYRRDEAEYVPDELWQSGDLTGSGGATPETRGSYDVFELFGEVKVPIVQDQPLAYEISFDAGYRFSDYSNAGTTDTYKFGLQWAPTVDLRMRASLQHAVRAPNLTELFVPLAVTNSGVLGTDPCAGPNPTATLEQCMNTGVTLAQWGNGTTTNTILQCPAGQCSVRQGGNPDLAPESSDTVSAGIVLTPRFIPGLTASIDWFRIEQEDLIGVVPITTVLQRCLETGDAEFCSRIERTPQGFLFGDTTEGGGWILTPTENLGSGTTSGVDVQAAYTLPLGDSVGSLTAALVGSYLLEAKIRPDPDDAEYDCAGLYGPTCALLAPEWRHTLRVSWDTPWNALVSAQWRYIGEMQLENNSDEPIIGELADDPVNDKLKAASYLDLTGVWDIAPSLSLRAGVNNVLDRSPQVVSGDVSGIGGPNAFPTYDLLGRVFFVGFTSSF